MASKQEDDATKEMNEDMDNAKEEEKCMPECMPECLPNCMPKSMPFKFWKFIFTGIAGTTLDVATDIYQCFKHFR